MYNLFQSCDPANLQWQDLEHVDGGNLYLDQLHHIKAPSIFDRTMITPKDRIEEVGRYRALLPIGPTWKCAQFICFYATFSAFLFQRHPRHLKTKRQ